MNTKNYTLLFFLFCVVFSNAQSNSKLDLRLLKRLQKEIVRDKMLSLLVQGDDEKIKLLTEKFEGTFKYSYNGISSIQLAEKNVLLFSKSKDVLRIEHTGAKGFLLLDSSRAKSNIDSIHAGASPLTNGLKGRNVLVGIIDGKVDFKHLDFRNADGSTRFRYIWDQVKNGNNMPLPYNYGTQWSWVDINSGNCTLTSDTFTGHGTHVTGIAAGNGLSLKNTPFEGQFVGMAPEAEIIYVRINEADESYLAKIADAVDYIFKKADALGKPCVINTSTGTYYGSHDGKDMTTQIIESLLDERSGRVLVAAGGNAGIIPHHLGYTVQQDSAYTFFKYNSGSQDIYFDLWADTANFNQVKFTVGCNDTLGNDLGRLAYYTIPADFGSTPLVTQNLFTQTSFLGQVSIQLTRQDTRYHVEFLVNPTNISHYWRLQTSGTGRFDLWSSRALLGTSDMTSFIRTGDILNPQAFIQYPNYRHPDSLKTMVSSWQCSDKVITVGNYTASSGYLDRDSVYRDMTIAPSFNVVEKRHASSSFGPTRDGRLKPDIMAPGAAVISTGDVNFIQVATAPSNRLKVSITKKHIRNTGTSMASPAVAGFAALYLEQKPTATYDEIKVAIICTARRDSFTGNSPNPEYGNGKLNGFAAITRAQGCITYGAKDTACINFNALANVDSGGCVAKKYGCTDPSADNYDSTANVSIGNCIFTSIRNLTENSVSVTVFPNPFSNTTTFKIQGADFEKGSIKLYDLQGKLVDEIKLNGKKMIYAYKNDKLAAGMYHFLLSGDNANLKTGKLVVE